MNFKINDKSIITLSCMLLFAPFLLFVLGYLKLVIAIPILILIALLSYRMGKMDIDRKAFIMLSGGEAFSIIATALLMTWLSGIGGCFPQLYDQYIRNAIYKDLIMEKWPVFYEQTDRALVYYFGYWLLPASVCKLFLPLATEYSMWLVARGVLFLYTFLYVLIILLMLIITVTRMIKISNISGGGITFCACIIFLIWGNLSIIGFAFSKTLDSSTWGELLNLKNPLLIEHWANKFAVSNGNLIQIMEVFNQSLPAWLGTVLFLYNKEKVNVYGLICLPLAILAPFPMCGLMAMMFMEWIILLIERKIGFAKIFSIENILSIPFVAVMIPFYAGGIAANMGISAIAGNAKSPLHGVLIVILFSLLTWGIYAIVVIERKTAFFWCVAILNFLFCFLMVGSAFDFKARSTIPFSIYFMICVIHLLIAGRGWRKNLVVATLLIAAIVPILNVYDCIKVAINEGTLAVENDRLYTLSIVAGEGDDPIIPQYTKLNPSKDVFFRYLAKGEYQIRNPVIEYRKDDAGNTYVSKIVLTSDMEARVAANIQSAENSAQNTQDILSGIDYDGIEVISLGDGTVPVTENEFIEIGEDEVDIVWSNYPNPVMAVVDFSYFGEDEIKYGSESGIALSLTDSDGNVLFYPYAYAYTSRVIYANDTERFIIPFPQFKEKGEYYLKFNFFYKNALKQNLKVEDDSLYRIVIK